MFKVLHPYTTPYARSRDESFDVWPPNYYQGLINKDITFNIGQKEGIDI